MTGKSAIIFFAHVFVVLSLWNPNPKPSNAKIKPDTLQKTIKFLPFIASLILFSATNIVTGILPIPVEFKHVQVTALDLALFAFGLIGIILRLWSYHTLGRFFTFDLTIRENHSLIGSGPYTCLRHPSYTGILLIYFTFSELVAIPYIKMINKDLVQIARIVFVMSSLGMTFFRVKNEEEMLSKEFKAEWREYAARRWRLIPFVY